MKSVEARVTQLDPKLKRKTTTTTTTTTFAAGISSTPHSLLLALFFNSGVFFFSFWLLHSFHRVGSAVSNKVVQSDRRPVGIWSVCNEFTCDPPLIDFSLRSPRSISPLRLSTSSRFSLSCVTRVQSLLGSKRWDDRSGCNPNPNPLAHLTGGVSIHETFVPLRAPTP